jgi:hypothetical protein
MADKCGKCTKTVYKQEEMKAAGKTWHKQCFKCMADGCTISLDLKSVNAHEGKIFCKTHKFVASKSKDGVVDKNIGNALAAPKKESESVGNVQKGGTKVGSLQASAAAAKAPIIAKTGEAKAPAPAPAAEAASEPAAAYEAAPEPAAEPAPEPVYEQPAEVQQEQPAEQAYEQPAEQPAEQAYEQPAEQPAEQYEQPAEQAYEQPAE